MTYQPPEGTRPPSRTSRYASRSLGPQFTATKVLTRSKKDARFEATR